jgi:branched-chain amino acid aminotransferase
MTIDMAKQLGIAARRRHRPVRRGQCRGDVPDLDQPLHPAGQSFNGAPGGRRQDPGPITKKLIDAYSKDVGCDFVGQYLKFLQ